MKRILIIDALRHCGVKKVVYTTNDGCVITEKL